MSNAAEWLKEITPHRREVTVCLDGALKSELEAVKDRLSFLPKDDSEERPSLERRAEELKAEIERKSHRFVFESVSRKQWQDLLAAHPPPADADGWGYNPEGFEPAAMAASCVEPRLTEEVAREYRQKLYQPESDRLWAACFEVNVIGSRDPFEDGFARVLRGERK